MAGSVVIGLVCSPALGYCRGVLRGVTRYARARPGWVLLAVPADAAGIRGLHAARPAGLVAHAFRDDLAAALARFRRPVVNVSGVLAEPRFPRVGVDDGAVGRLAAEHFLGRGFRHFGFVGHRDHAYSVAREAGFRAVVAAAGHAVAGYYDRRAAPFDPGGRLWALDRRLGRWLQALPTPAAVFTPNDLWGLQLTEVCRRAGLRVPEDVALAGVDDDDLLCELARPSLTSVAVPAERVGYEAAALLDRLLAGRGPPRRPLLLPPAGVAARQSSDVLAVDDADVAAAAAFIRQTGGRPVAVRDVLRVVAVSRRSLERRFRRHLGRGVSEEIRRVRTERARRLLAETGLPMSAVARESGFTSAEQLSVAFRREAGTTPTAYRRQTRGPGAE